MILLSGPLYSQNDLEVRLQNVLDSIYLSNPDAVGIMVHVEAPDQGISWSSAAGYSDKNEKTPLQADQPVLIASSIKTYVSAAILRLVEQEKLTIDQAIATLLSDKTKLILEKDGYDLSSIQVQHLMSHTSGVWNYANQAYIDHKRDNPNYRWTRDEQLQLTVDKGDPLGLPGAQFHYSDANYLLLTEIIESLTLQPFYVAMRTLLKYDELQLNHTWFPTLEDQPVGTKALVHQYRESYDWDSYELDVSWDLYGGGGIACPTKDLARFVQSYFNGKIVSTDSIRDLIFTAIPAKETEIYPYYLGLSQSNYHGMNAYGHGGFWATVMMYFPSINASISVCILERDQGFLRRNILSAISELLLTEHNKRQNKNKQIADYLDQLSDFSGSILVVHQDEFIEHHASGLASIEHQVKNTTDTKFCIASISKLITATGVLQLVEQGKIDLNEKVGTYLPEYPNAIIRDSATVHHLLTHTSGIPPFYGGDYLQSDKTQYKTVRDFFPLFEKDSLRFLPGEQYQYSGSGFVLLGAIIEQVTGMDYYAYIDRFIFQKAGMHNSLAIPTDSIVSNKANGYTCFWGDHDYFSRNDYYMSKASPAGSHYSTTSDLFLFSKALRNGLLINEESYALQTAPKTKGYNTHLGYGIDIDQRYDEQVIGHSGGWFGIRAELMDFPASEYTVVVLSNQDDDGKSGASKVIEDLKQIIAGEQRIVKRR